MIHSIRLLDIAIAAGVGIGATLLVDVWNLVLKQAFRIPSLSSCLLGRWVLHMPGGVFRHRAIGRAERKPFECLIGWAAHYGIGVGLAGVFLFLLAPEWLERPSLAPALHYGLATVVLPFFVLQPSLGLGIASAATPHPTKARLKSLATHTAYGVGVYVFGSVAAYLTTR